MKDRPTNLRRFAGRAAHAGAVACAALACLAGAAAAEPPPATTRLLYTPGKIVPIPASIPHEEGDMVDQRIIPDLRWIGQHYPIFITDGYSGPLPNGEHVGCHLCHVKHSDHYNGLAVDIVPLEPSSRCDSAWAPITRLARWAEPRQNQPVPPFRWVGYNGDAGHGCGNHLHLSWNHAPAPQFQLAEWVEVFPVGSIEGGEPPRGKKPRAPKAPPGPSGGISQVPTGGVSDGVSQVAFGGLSPRGTGD
ncbi:MAG: hypothetical protein U0R26_08005 [Solirubrobacterales bacterium]